MADTKNNLLRTYEYRLRTNKTFVAACERTLDEARFVYNCALEQRKSWYAQGGRSISFNEQSRQLTDARKDLPAVKACLRTIQTDALKRLETTFESFFKRGAGFPRFKGKERYHTFSQVLEPGRACPLKGDKLTIPGVGSTRVRLSRPLPDGSKVKQLRVTRRADGWYGLLVCEMPKPEPLPPTGESVGVDVGIKTFATLSTGEVIENPRFTERAARQLTKKQRQLSKKKKGSANRKKARGKVAKAHLKTERCRKQFHHEQAKKLVERFDDIAVEELNVAGLVKNHKLAKAILSVAWAQFFAVLIVKAVSAGRRVEKVPARFTTQDCSGCGHRQKMPLAVRVYECGGCGVVLDRDHNAALNIRSRAECARIDACEVGRPTLKQERERLTAPLPGQGKEACVVSRTRH